MFFFWLRLCFYIGGRRFSLLLLLPLLLLPPLLLQSSLKAKKDFIDVDVSTKHPDFLSSTLNSACTSSAVVMVMVGLSTDEKPRFTLPPPPPPPPLLFGLLLSLEEEDFGWAVVVAVVFLGGGAELLLESGLSLLEQQPMVPRFYPATKEEIAIFCRRKFDRKQQVTDFASREN